MASFHKGAVRAYTCPDDAFSCRFRGWRWFGRFLEVAQTNSPAQSSRPEAMRRGAVVVDGRVRFVPLCPREDLLKRVLVQLDIQDFAAFPFCEGSFASTEGSYGSGAI